MSGEVFVLALVAGVVLFLLRRAWRRPRGPGFPPHFTPHVAVQLTPRRAAAMQGRCRAVFAVGPNGFTARFDLPAALEPGVPQRLEAEFLRPDIALAHFSPGTVFSMLDGGRLLADGEVLGQNVPHEPGQGRRPPL